MCPDENCASNVTTYTVVTVTAPLSHNRSFYTRCDGMYLGPGVNWHHSVLSGQPMASVVFALSVDKKA